MGTARIHVTQEVSGPNGPGAVDYGVTELPAHITWDEGPHTVSVRGEIKLGLTRYENFSVAVQVTLQTTQEGLSSGRSSAAATDIMVDSLRIAANAVGALGESFTRRNDS